MHLFQSGGFYSETNPPLGRPILSPAPASPGGGGWFTPRLPPDNALQLPTSEGDPARGMPGHGRPEEAGRSATPASTSHLSDARRGAVPHGFLQPLVALAPGGREEPEPAPEPKPERAGAGGGGGAGREGVGGREGGKAPFRRPRPGAGPGGADGRGGGTRRSLETGARAGAAKTALRRAPRPAARCARSLAAALTHIPSIPEELLVGGPGLGRGHLRGGQQRAPGPGKVQARRSS